MFTNTLKKRLWLFSTAFTLCISSQSLYAYANGEVKKNNKQWMASISKEIANKTIRQMVLPGTHDSGSRSAISRAAEKWTETQNYTIKQQLEDGIRYLDFRVAYGAPIGHSKKWKFVHGNFNMWDEVSPSLEHIKTFLIENPKEVIIVDFQRFPHMDEEDDKNNFHELRNMLMDKLRKYMLPESKGVHQTIQSLWDSDQRLIVLMDNAGRSKLGGLDKKLVWSRDYITSPWADESHSEDVAEYLDERIPNMNKKDKELNKSNHDRFYVVQGVTTPAPPMDGVEHLASEMNPLLLSILEGNKVALDLHYWRNAPGLNIIIADYVDKLDITPVIKSMNMDSIKNGKAKKDKPIEDGVYLYEHKNYEGYYTRLNENTPSLKKRFIVDEDGYDDHTNFNDEVSSIKIIGDYHLEIYKDENFKGNFQRITYNEENLADFWNDKVSSVKVYRNGDNKLQDGVYLYEHSEYGGKYIRVNDDTTLNNFNDKASSLRIVGNYKAELYKDTNFNGDKETIKSNIRKFDSNWNDEVSSIKVVEIN